MWFLCFKEKQLIFVKKKFFMHDSSPYRQLFEPSKILLNNNAATYFDDNQLI